MEYYQINFKIVPDSQENRDVLMAYLGNQEFESFVEKDDCIEAYVVKDSFKSAELDDLNLEPLFSFKYEKQLIPDQNWNKVWEENYFKPLLIDDKCLIRAPFHDEYPSAEFEIVIEPKMAFGTGNHETTALMIKHLLQHDLNGKVVLDMGCGTGVLSILSAMKGAANVLAIDIDEWAYESSVENSEINKCPQIKVLQGDADKIEGNNFDLVLANIHKNVLINDMQHYVNSLKFDGELIMSGFYIEDLIDIENVAKSIGLDYVSHFEQKKWVAAIFRKKKIN